MSASAKITIRPRQTPDLPALIRIHHAVHAATGYPVEAPFATTEETISFLSPRDSQIWVAELDSSSLTPYVVGQVALHPFKRNAKEDEWAAEGCTPTNSRHVGRLFVDPAAQGLGAGRTLMETVMSEAEAEAQGLRLCIYVITKDVAAVRLYERIGWKRIGMETYQGWDNWMYVWWPEWGIKGRDGETVGEIRTGI